MDIKDVFLLVNKQKKYQRIPPTLQYSTKTKMRIITSNFKYTRILKQKQSKQKQNQQKNNHNVL